MFVFFVNVCFVCFVVVVIEEGGRTRRQKNAAFSEKAKDDANIIVVVVKVRALRASVCALNGPHFALCVQ